MLSLDNEPTLFFNICIDVPNTYSPTSSPTNIVLGRWTTVASTGINPSRQQHSSVINAATGLIYTIGGWAGGSQYLSDVWAFNIQTGKLMS